MIKALTEILVDVGLCKSQRQATSMIKKGVVYVDGLRCANTDALLVITRGATIRVDEEEVEIRERD